MYEKSRDGIAAISLDGRLTRCNSAFREMLGYEEEEIYQLTYLDITPEKWHATEESILRGQVLERGYSQLFEKEYRRKDGTVFPVELRAYLEVDSCGRKTGMWAVVRDITERKIAEAKLNLAAKIIDESSEAILLTDPAGIILQVNEAFCEQSGYAREELLSRKPNILKSGRHTPEFYRDMWDCLIQTGRWQGEIWDRRKTGEIYPKLLSISTVRDDTDSVTHYVGFSSDISSIKQTEAQLQQLAHYDPLTGLANRILFRERLDRAIVETGRAKNIGALMALDLDRFKNVNDTLGHPAGDELLVVVGNRLKACLRDVDTVSRLGGDEFTVILTKVHRVDEVSIIARRILEVLSQPCRVAGKEVYVTVSIGISVFPVDSTAADELLQNADTALYHAKEQGRDNFQFFSREMNVALREKTDLEVALRGAIERKELALAYQPMLDLKTGRIVGAEALLRWSHPTMGSISPLRIIPLAEETGLIVPIGEWVLRTACEDYLKWQNTGFPPGRVAVNVSGRQLSDPTFIEKLDLIIRETGVDPTFLELELTESVALKDVENTIKVLSDIRRRGIGICLDDFGTGYSSLSYLKLLPIHKLKIDRSFLQDVFEYGHREPIIGAIIYVAHSLGLTVVAEGIETKQQLGAMHLLECDQWQGFYFSEALPEARFAAVLREGLRAVNFEFVWTPELSVDVQKIDEQHQEWFNRARDLFRSIIKGKREDELLEFVDFLSDYSRLHFGDEEELMREHRYPFYEAQRRAHGYLVNQIDRLREKVRAGERETDLLVEIMTSLHDWFVTHINTMDRQLGQHLRTRQSEAGD